MKINIARTSEERIVIIGGGFGGLKLARGLRKKHVQIVLIDQNNFHQFQPLFYQVATSGLEPNSILFPFRKLFQRSENIHFRMARVEQVLLQEKKILTSIGELDYDRLVIATGAGNNFFGNEAIEKYALPMKSIQESLRLRNLILERFEQALSVSGEERSVYLTIVIAGAGPTGVELAGTLAEMKRFILPKEYPELKFEEMRIWLVEGASRVLSAMGEKSSEKARDYLKKLGVEVFLNTRVNNYDGTIVSLSTGQQVPTRTLIWAAGIKGDSIKGIPESAMGHGNRIRVNVFNQVIGSDEVYAIGDIAIMEGDAEYKDGHPQLAQVAIQQGKWLSKNLKRALSGEEMKPFSYRNLGTMATIGRNKAVVELPRTKFYGFFAWLIWLGVHLRSILGVKNKFIVFMNWVWNYFTYNLSLRLIIKSPGTKVRETKRKEKTSLSQKT